MNRPNKLFLLGLTITIILAMGIFDKLKSAISGTDSTIASDTSKTNLAKFEEIRNKIYPWIKVTYAPNEDVPNSKHEIKLKGQDQPIMQEWLGNLSIFYVVDEGNSFNVLLKRDLPDSIPISELHKIATTNLERDVEFKFNQTNFGAAGLIAGGDHEAGALCLPGVWEWCSNQYNDNLIVAVPEKDMVLMVPASDKEKIDSLKIFVTEFFKTGEMLLTKQLYLYDKSTGKWTIWGQAE
jgi:uncharacterized protein YtpQ (UPF0354 family)